MKKILPLITSALIALGATLSVVSPASASVPPEHTYSELLTQGSNPIYGYGYDSIDVSRDHALAGNALFEVYSVTNHLGQHEKIITITNRPGMNIHVRVDSGSSIVDYHTTTGATHTWWFYYPVRKFAVTLDGWEPGWFAPPPPPPIN